MSVKIHVVGIGNIEIPHVQHIEKIALLNVNCDAKRNTLEKFKSKYPNVKAYSSIREKDLDGGILFTQFSHFIDLFIWLLGSAVEVQSFAANYNHKNIIKFEDSLVSIIKFESGVIVTMNFTINSYSKNMSFITRRMENAIEC